MVLSLHLPHGFCILPRHTHTVPGVNLSFFFPATFSNAVNTRTRRCCASPSLCCSSSSSFDAEPTRLQSREPTQGLDSPRSLVSLARAAIYSRLKADFQYHPREPPRNVGRRNNNLAARVESIHREARDRSAFNSTVKLNFISEAARPIEDILSSLFARETRACRRLICKTRLIGSWLHR